VIQFDKNKFMLRSINKIASKHIIRGVLKMKNILVPIENFSEDQEIITEAVELAKKFDSEITLFHVDNAQMLVSRLQYEAYIDREIMTEKMDTKESQEKLIKKYNDQGVVNVNVKELVGDPASEILNEANEGDYDLVVMRTHGMTATKRFMLGSVTNKVVHHIKKPILVVR
ncbi:MAG: universal stress protein, partial [Bacillota bacterium]|nr:universal stress protein [Bacillota bacterium]